MKNFKIVVQQEQHFNIVLPYHENYSIDVDGLVSIIYLNGKPIGMILNCYTAPATTTTFADGADINLKLNQSISPAYIWRYAYAEDGLALNNTIASAFSDVFAAGSSQRLTLRDEKPDATIMLNFVTNDSKIKLNSRIGANAVRIMKDARGYVEMLLKSSAEAFNTVWAETEHESITFADRAILSVNTILDAVPSGMTISTSQAPTSLFTPFYIEAWADNLLSDVADMTMSNIMYGEVIE